MALGIEQNSIAPNLIFQSGKMLSDNIRDIGKQVQSSIYEINTRKDLASMAEEIQSGAVIPQSDNFAQDAVALGFRHPLAIQDPRGQMALNVLGKSHGEWKQGQLAQQRINPYRSMTGGGIYNSATGEILTPPSGRTGASKGYSAIPGGRGVLNRDTGVVEPLPEGMEPPGLTPAQQAVQQRATVNRRLGYYKNQLAQTDQHIKSFEKRYQELNKEEGTLKVGTDDERLNKLYAERKEAGETLQALGRKRDELRSAFESEALTGTSGEDVTGAPDALAPEGTVAPSSVLPGGPAVQQGGAVVPAPGQIAPPAPDGAELVVVINPQGKRTRIRKSQLESALQNGYQQP